ncbi:TspO/MBR family protein [Pelagicoccus sp. SDUM812003]|uniref:TspO/MBR family protein n=1 Tax=Pelagicoccus sp. SDUM812003 TaxID=3041267 RepID=UPI00280EFBD0|nr:TspO/MBR family protein [Pelagicoccus sp. SDUM812003]MDQ8204616.1 tryptophan-rich sensory protein [Pelagicoccus sp. SDUM812003]
MISRKSAGKLIMSFAAVYATAAIGSIASISAKEFYSELARPSWAPPGWLFGPVWTVLFTMMGISLWLVWQQARSGERRLELGVFCAQLTINAIWSWLFFQWKLGGWAFADILLLIVLVLFAIRFFWIRSKLAACLLIPYLAWISFAAALNLALWQANPQSL